MNSDYTTHAIRELANELEKYTEDNEHYTWYSELEAKLPGTITVKLFLEDKISAFYGKQIIHSSILFLKNAFYSHGNMVKGSLVSDTTSREYERRRRLMSALKAEGGVDDHPKLLPMAKAGFAFPYDKIKRVEAITFGNRFSIYFFGTDEVLVSRINDVTEDELSQIKEIFDEFNIEWTLEEFKLPMRDICLFAGLGLVLLVIGWLLVLLIFP